MPPRARKPAESKAKSTCKLSCCAVSDELKASIKASVEAGRGRSMFPDDPAEAMPLFGANCRCGIHRKPPGLAKHVADDGTCPAHPDGPPQPWVRGAESHGQSERHD